MLPLFLGSESSATGSVTDAMSNVASSSSTPPTTVADSDSLHSDTSKHDVVSFTEPLLATAQIIQLELAPEPVSMPETTPQTEPTTEPTPVLVATTVSVEYSPRRARRTCAAAPVYNLSKLSGTDGHGKRRANGDDVADRRRRTISGDTLVNDGMSTRSIISTRAKSRGGTDAIDALDLGPAGLDSPGTSRRIGHDSPRARRLSSRAGAGVGVGATVTSFGSRLSKISKRGSKAVAGSMSRVSRELLRLRDTKEFSHIDERPVIHTVWANGKYVDPSAQPPPSPRQKKAKAREAELEEKPEEPIIEVKPRGPKKFLTKGLYAGQDVPKNPAQCLTLPERKKLDSIPEIATFDLARNKNMIDQPPNRVMPTLAYAGVRLLLQGRDFKLPFMTCNPLPPGQPKPDEWKKMTKSETAQMTVTG